MPTREWAEAWAKNSNGTYGPLQQTLEEYIGGGGGGGGAASGNPYASELTPSKLAALFKQPDVTLPGTEGAKAAQRDLQLAGIGGLKNLIGRDPYADRAAIKKALYDSAASDINYSGDRLAQDAKEAQNAKGMLFSSATNYFLDPIERNRSLALERASQDAFVRANDISNANRAAEATTLGQAFSEGTTGLQGEANVENANRTANQSAVTSGYQTGAQLGENAANRAQQESQFGRSLSQQKDLQEQAFQNARDIASSNQLSAGIGGGLSGLASIFGPTLNKGLDRLVFG